MEFTTLGEADGFALREVPGVPGDRRYAITFDRDNQLVRWLSCAGANLNCTPIDSSPAGSFALADGVALGVAVTGTGTNTVLRVWKNPVGTDVSGWGSPAWISGANPAQAADTGTAVGVFTDRLGDFGELDDFAAGAID
jgi:hypothetical protein